MKRTVRKQLQLNVETVRTLQSGQPLDPAQLKLVVGGCKSASGYKMCTPPG